MPKYKIYRSWKDLCGFTIGFTGWFYEIKGITLISHGAWCDPELVYRGKSYNYYDVEDYFLADYREEFPDGDETEGFSQYMLNRAGDVKWYIINELRVNKRYYNAPSLAYPI